nr:MAG TPA: hypothetical protein [Caudoviricetes sp.]
MLHCLAWIHNRAHSYIPYYNRRLRWPVQRPARRWYPVSVGMLRLMVCPPAWRSRCIGSLCICCIVCAGIGQISGNATVKPCKRFWRFGCINCMDNRKATANACAWLIRCRAKRKARPFLTG